MPIAVCYIRPEPAFRRDAYVNGLARIGYRIVDAGKPESREDFLVIWNKQQALEAKADEWERDGGSVLVAENGYLGRDQNGVQLYALAVHGHNGSGWFPVGDDDRFSRLGARLEPWVDRPEGYALICGQRGIGSRLMASPANWHLKVAGQVTAPTRVRLHPGNKHQTPVAGATLAEDLAGARGCVIWSSAAGVAALVAGVPVQFDAPHWICQDAAVKVGATGWLIDDKRRSAALHKMSWGQWTIEELNTGEPFERIRQDIGSASW